MTQPRQQQKRAPNTRMVYRWTKHENIDNMPPATIHRCGEIGDGPYFICSREHGHDGFHATHVGNFVSPWVVWGYVEYFPAKNGDAE